MRLTNVTYYKKTCIKLRRAFPEKPNHCKLSVYANALNFLGYKQKFGSYMTPEKLLLELNEVRRLNGEKPTDPQEEIIQSDELENYLVSTKLGKTKTLMGAKYLDLNLWKKLVKNKFLLAPDHQQLYYIPKDGLNLNYLPKDMLNRLVRERRFSYQDFISFYKIVFQKYGPIDEGHVDIVLDIVNINDIEHVILGNLTSKLNKPYLKIPWNLFANYLLLDWGILKEIRNVSEFPDQKSFEKLRKQGFLENEGYASWGFGYGAVEIFYKSRQQETLEKILKPY